MRRMGRRLFLGGAGATVALPFLHSALPKTMWAAPMDLSQQYFFPIFFPNGVPDQRPYWTPSEYGTNYEATRPIQPFIDAGLREKITILSGVDNDSANDPGNNGAHTRGVAGMLSSVTVNHSETDIRAGITMDQHIANHINHPGIKSMQLSIGKSNDLGNCDAGYACAYADCLSWADERQFLPPLIDPQMVYAQLFPNGITPTDGSDDAQSARLRALEEGILSRVKDDINSVKGRLGQDDKVRLDQYLTSVEEVERRLRGAVLTQSCNPNINLAFANGSRKEHTAILLDLARLAFQCDRTRVISFMLGVAGDNGNFNGEDETITFSDAFHNVLSHHSGDDTKKDRHVTVLSTLMRWTARVLKDMDAIDMGDGTTLLDKSLVFISSDISHSDRHHVNDMPIILAGSANGQLQTGRHVNMEDQNDDPTFGDLMLNFADLFGAGDNLDRFGTTRGNDGGNKRLTI